MKHIFTLPLLLFTFFIVNSQVTYTEIIYDMDETGFFDQTRHGDLDGDGLDDIILISSGKEIRVGLNKNLEEPDFIIVSGELDKPDNVEIYDFDHDGDIDILESDKGTDESYWWENDGSANFTKHTFFSEDYSSIAFVDLDGDGIDEMILGVFNGMSIYSLMNSEISWVSNITSSITSKTRDILTLDYNNDGLMDIIAAFSSGIYLYQQIPDINFTETVIDGNFYNIESVVASDINNDSVFDFLIYSGWDKKTTILRSLETGEYEKETLADGSGNTQSIFGFSEGDNIIDVLYAEQIFINTSISIYKEDNGTFSQDVIIKENLKSIGGMGLTDLDGDGDVDIYVFNSVSFDNKLHYFIAEPAIDNDEDGYTEDEDCDDDNPDVNPGEVEIAYNGLDDDCDPLTLDDDLDEDGFLLADDCDDNNPDINPDATEIPDNGIDEDCDGNDLTDIEEFAYSMINIYPNPTFGKVNLDIPSHLSVEISLLDFTGKLICVGNGANEINLKTEEEGLYLLKITDRLSGASVMKRVILVK